MPISEITHKGQKVLLIDYTPYKKKEEMIAQLQKVGEYFRNSTNPVRSVTDLTGAYLSSEFMDEMKAQTKASFQGRSEKSAVIGITGIKKILLDAFNLIATPDKRIKAFSNKEAALEYVAS